MSIKSYVPLFPSPPPAPTIEPPRPQSPLDLIEDMYREAVAAVQNCAVHVLQEWWGSQRVILVLTATEAGYKDIWLIAPPANKPYFAVGFTAGETRQLLEIGSQHKEIIP